MTLMMTSAQVVETSVNVTNNSPSRDYSHPDDQTTQTTETPGFKPFTVLNENYFMYLSPFHVHKVLSLCRSSILSGGVGFGMDSKEGRVTTSNDCFITAMIRLSFRSI